MYFCQFCNDAKPEAMRCKCPGATAAWKIVDADEPKSFEAWTFKRKQAWSRKRVKARRLLGISMFQGQRA